MPKKSDHPLVRAKLGKDARAYLKGIMNRMVELLAGIEKKTPEIENMYKELVDLLSELELPEKDHQESVQQSEQVSRLLAQMMSGPRSPT